MTLNDCTNCLNRGRCSVKGGPGQYFRNVPAGYMRDKLDNGHGGGLAQGDGETGRHP